MNRRSLEQVLADTRGDGQVLRSRGHGHDAQLLEKVCDEVAAAAEDYLTWLKESKARLRSGHSFDWLRARFNDWLSQGNARWNGKEREYRAIVIPRRAHEELDYAAGERAAERRSA